MEATSAAPETITVAKVGNGYTDHFIGTDGRTACGKVYTKTVEFPLPHGVTCARCNRNGRRWG